MKNVLVFGGAFNPPTKAHLSGAYTAMKKTARDGVIFVPSQSGYIRDEQQKDYVFSGQERLELLRRLSRTRPWMAVSDHELKSPTQPRTYETLCYFRAQGLQPALLIGSDKLGELETVWKFIPQICQEFGIVCLVRGSDNARAIIDSDPFLSSVSSGITLVPMPPEEASLSSTAARQALRAGDMKTLAQIVPEPIIPDLQRISREQTLR